STFSAPARRKVMSYRIAGIDVHKKMLAVVVADVEVEGEYQFERRLFGGNPDHLRLLAHWLIEQQVEEVVMESTAQYWKPVWGALEQYWKPIQQLWLLWQIRICAPHRHSCATHSAPAPSSTQSTADC